MPEDSAAEDGQATTHCPLEDRRLSSFGQKRVDYIQAEKARDIQFAVMREVNTDA